MGDTNSKDAKSSQTGHRFNVIPITTAKSCIDINHLILKFIWKGTGTAIVKTISKIIIIKWEKPFYKMLKLIKVVTILLVEEETQRSVVQLRNSERDPHKYD